MDGPGESEASGTNRADRITAPCRQLIVVYQFGSQGAYENERPITITADTLVTSYGESWKNENGALPLYPEAEAQHTKARAVCDHFFKSSATAKVLLTA